MVGCEGLCGQTEEQLEDENKIVNITVDKSIISKVQTKKHIFYSDETPEWGGNDEYPDPWDYILGGLGACITTTIRQYADKHFMKLERAEVELTYSYDLSSDSSPYIVDKKIKLIGDLSEEEKDRLLLISNSPAQKMLTRGIDIRTV